MSAALADLLVDLTEAEVLKEFRKDPEKVMEDRNLTALDRAALRSRVGGWIRHQANSIKDDPAVPSVDSMRSTAMALAVVAVEVVEAVDVVEITVHW